MQKVSPEITVTQEDAEMKIKMIVATYEKVPCLRVLSGILSIAKYHCNEGLTPYFLYLLV